jgi:hypothetical protein
MSYIIYVDGGNNMFKVGMGVIRKRNAKTGSIVGSHNDSQSQGEIYLVRWTETGDEQYYTRSALESRHYIVTEKVIW